MSRAPLDYSARRAPARGEGYDVSTPTAGYYRIKLRGDGVYGAVRIWHGPPHDPDTGEELDRSWRWQATMNCQPIDLDRVWPACGRSPISEREAARLVQLATWARENAPDSAYADPKAKHDLLNCLLPF